MAMTTSNLQYLTDANTDGAVLGRSASSKLGFYGASVVAQQATLVSVTTTAPISVAGSACFGYASSDQAAAIVSRLNSLITYLKTYGLVA